MFEKLTILGRVKKNKKIAKAYDERRTVEESCVYIKRKMYYYYDYSWEE